MIEKYEFMLLTSVGMMIWSSIPVSPIADSKIFLDWEGAKYRKVLMDHTFACESSFYAQIWIDQKFSWLIVVRTKAFARFIKALKLCQIQEVPTYNTCQCHIPSRISNFLSKLLNEMIHVLAVPQKSPFISNKVVAYCNCWDRNLFHWQQTKEKGA